MKNVIICILLCSILPLEAQVKQSYSFDSDEQLWSSSDKGLWSFDNTLASNGTGSIRYSTPRKSILPQKAIFSIDTEHTIMKVRTAHNGTNELIIASDYDGVIMAVDFGGAILWKSKTGIGTMNHGVWCADLNNDGTDEILAANANGTLFCLDIDGTIQWQFKPLESVHQTPMYSVCAVKDESLTSHIVCGDLSCNIYYLDAEGNLEKKIHSTKYSKIKGWGDDCPEDFYSNANFLLPIPQKDGSDLLLVNTTNSHMQGSGDLVIMKPLSESAHLYIEDPKGGKAMGDVRVFDNDKDGICDLVYGSSTLGGDVVNRIMFNADYSEYTIVKHTLDPKKSGGKAYRVNQIIHLPGTGDNQYSVLSADQFHTYTVDAEFHLEENLSTVYSYFDIWNAQNGTVLLASSQDGGSCIHVIDPQNESWKKEYEQLVPIGNISKLLAYKKDYSSLLDTYNKPDWQREPRKVVGLERPSNPFTENLSNESKTLELLSGVNNAGKQDRSWRSPLYDGNIYKDKYDKRMDYSLNAQQVYEKFEEALNQSEGVSAWGGHGNDPLYYSLDVMKRIADTAKAFGNKELIYIYPEMNAHNTDFEFVMANHFYPLMEHLKHTGGKIGIRTKNVYWQGPIYKDVFKRIVSGEFADVVIPLMEETTDKTQDLSLMGRMGFWAAGSVEGWGVRCSRDDPSFDRSRQFSSQKMGNHILRKTIYSIASGASYIHHSYMHSEASDYHINLALKLIEKEALFVPKRNEILSISPVHISIHKPSDHYIEEAENHKWTGLYNKEQEDNNPMVFSHMKGHWLGAALTPWDFSSYASGVVDRRQNAIPPYPNGQVLITPVQSDALMDSDAPRGKLVDKLHPIYKDILKEYITDGVDYISADGTQRFKANEYYQQVKKDIEERSKKLPLTVKGDKVGWVVAQMSPTHLRLTLVDGGYLSPKERHVQVTFNTINPVSLTDVLDGKTFQAENGKVEIDVPCGMFRFIDVELSKPLL